jgi:hypothetical protein
MRLFWSSLDFPLASKSQSMDSPMRLYGTSLSCQHNPMAAIIEHFNFIYVVFVFDYMITLQKQ